MIPTKPYGMLILIAISAMSLTSGCWQRFTQVHAIPAPVDDLSLSLWPQSSEKQQQVVEPASHAMERILNDQYADDFLLSISSLNQMAWSLEEYVRRRQLEDKIANGDAMSKWALSMGLTDEFSQTIARELDLVLATFWSKFKPTIESIIAHRPPGLDPRELDFRCTRRRTELGDVMALSAQSSLYSIYMDTLVSELYMHCLQRKLALLKVNNFEPTPLLKQFVATYLELPFMDPNNPDSRRQFNQMLTDRAASFNPEAALTRIGSLGSAAKLVVDSRIFLAPTPDANRSAEMVQQLVDNCSLYSKQLGSVWGDFDDFTKIISTGTSNLEKMNQKIKLAVPRLIYASICGQLIQLPLWT